MESDHSSSAAVIIGLGILAFLLLAGAALFLVVQRAPAMAPVPVPAAAGGGGGAGSASTAYGYTATWKSATQGPDGSWTLVLTLQQGKQTWDTVQVTGEVFGWQVKAGPWPAKLETKIPQNPAPASFDVTFTTGPIDRAGPELGLRLSIDSSYRGLTGGGNSSASSSLRFPEPAAPPAPGK